MQTFVIPAWSALYIQHGSAIHITKIFTLFTALKQFMKKTNLIYDHSAVMKGAD